MSKKAKKIVIFIIVLIFGGTLVFGVINNFNPSQYIEGIIGDIIGAIVTYLCGLVYSPTKDKNGTVIKGFRPVIISTFIILQILLSIFAIFGIIFSNFNWISIFSIITLFFTLISIIGLWNMKKWSAKLLIFFTLISIIITSILKFEYTIFILSTIGLVFQISIFAYHWKKFN